MADRNGYIGRAPGDSSVVVSRQIFSPTGVTTDFTFSSGYTVGYGISRSESKVSCYSSWVENLSRNNDRRIARSSSDITVPICHQLTPVRMLMFASIALAVSQ